jgi:apolipoprotein N-acyltransferase
MKYRLAGAAGGLLLMAGNFYGPLCILQALAMLPLMILILKEPKPKAAAVAGLYMGLTFTIPQMIALRIPIPVTILLLIWFTLLLVVLCLCIAYLLPRSALIGSLATGAIWALLDWLNYTAVPIWGMAQSFARCWTAWPLLIQFISITGISGIVFVIGALQGLATYALVSPPHRKQAAIGIASILILMGIANTSIWMQKPAGHIRMAAAGWIFDDRSAEIDPHSEEGFEKLFAAPAHLAAQEGAALFTTGELGFYIADHDRTEWMERFGRIAKENNLWLAVGYFNIAENKNRMFFMPPEGRIIEEYTKTYLTPFEPAWNGDGDLKTIEVNGVSVGGMICQDDNFARLTRYYGRYKTPVVLCPTADWWTIKDAHLQAVQARAIEGRYAIVRGAANGISAIIDPKGTITAIMDHYTQGPGYVIADVPIFNTKTLFSRYGHGLLTAISSLILLATAVNKKGGPKTALDA